MKIKKILLIFLTFIIVISVGIALSGCLKTEPVSIESIILSGSVDANGNPTAESGSFTEGIDEIYLVIKLSNMKKTDNISVKWTYLDKDLEIDSKSFTPEDDFTGNKIFKIKISQGFPFGNYEVRVFLNGAQVKTIPFNVG
jgi:hypothetical protein